MADERTIYCGITPTYVGNTIIKYKIKKGIRDHPHLRGEHLLVQLAIVIFLGSPPLTWGTPETKPVLTDEQRITPTYVGNTRTQIN